METPENRPPSSSENRPPLKDSLGLWTRRLSRAAAVGVVAGVAAALLEAGLVFGSEHLIGRFTELGTLAFLEPRWEILALPAAGGLLSGLLLYWLAPDMRGHGTGTFLTAFHHDEGRLALRGPVANAGAAVGVISCGGSAGPEGPIASLGAAIGSAIGRGLEISAREQRTLLLSGCAAAVGALFGCPLGGALFAASVLYREEEFEGRSLVSAFIASAVGYSTYVAFWGQENRVLANTRALDFGGAIELPVYLVLGLCGGVTAIFFSLSLHRVERGFAALTAIPRWGRPVLGGLLTGGLACLLPAVIDPHYETVQNAFDGSLFSGPEAASDWLGIAGVLGLIVIAKCIATAFTVGSGAAGGVLGPSVFIGGTVGAALGALCMGLAPEVMPETLRQALVPVGMAGVLAASMRTPIAAMAIVMEMTGSFGLIVPLMLVTMTAYLIGRRWGLVDEQVRTASESPAHAGDSVVHFLEQRLVGEVMDPHWPLHAERSTPLAELLARVGGADSAMVPVVESNEVIGVIALPELRHLLDGEDLPPVVIAADLMTEKPFTLHPDDTLYDAVAEFERRGLDAIPVVARGRRLHGQWQGVLCRSHVHDTMTRYLGTLRGHLLREHAGIAALEQQSEMAHLLAGMDAPRDRRLERLRAGTELAGRSLAELDFRAKRGREVLAIQTRDGQFRCPPDPRAPLHADDVLLVMAQPGSAESAPEEEATG